MLGRLLKRKAGPAPLDRLAELILQRGVDLGADRISFGTPLECEPPPPDAIPAVDIWYRRPSGWENATDAMPAAILSGLIHGLESRFSGPPTLWEGRTIRVGPEGRMVRLPLSLSPQGAFLIDLLP